MRKLDRRLAAPAVLLAALAVAAPVAAGDDADDTHPRFRFGGALSVAAPTGEFADHVDVAGGLSGVALFGRPRGLLALRADAGWLLYGSQTLRRPVPGTAGRVLEDVARTDNWIAHAALGPQLMARSGRVRPYAHAFAGVSYFATSSELVRPRRTGAFGDPFHTTTHESDSIGSYGAGTGVLIGLGGGGTALDLGVRYVANGRVRYLADDDPLDGPPRRSEGHLVVFRLGIAALR
jgi:hypothetical protein